MPKQTDNSPFTPHTIDYDWCQLTEIISSSQIDDQVSQMGAQISKDYGNTPGGLIVVGLLDGCFLFMADLIRHIDIKEGITTAFIKVSSYKGLERTNNLKIVRDLDDNISQGSTILLVDDILDTGHTMSSLVSYLYSKGADKVISAVALDKSVCRQVDISPDYSGFVVDDLFVVGYGLDYHSKFRNLGSIYELTMKETDTKEAVAK